MPTLDASILKTIEEIGEHYKSNLSNRHLRKALLSMQMEPGTWDLIESFIDLSDYARYQGYRFDELYDRIVALAKFVYKARTEVGPLLKSSLGTVRIGREEANDRIIREMAISNFDSNLGVFSDLIHELYMKVVEFDRASHQSKQPVYERMPELKELGRLLIQE